MRSYEVIYILRPELSDDETQVIVERFEQMVRENDGVVEKTDRRGKRRLAYEIDRCQEGHYVLMNYQGLNALNQELDRRMKLHEGILRHLIMVRPETKPESEPEAEADVQEEAEAVANATDEPAEAADVSANTAEVTIAEAVAEEAVAEEAVAEEAPAEEASAEEVAEEVTTSKTENNQEA